MKITIDDIEYPTILDALKEEHIFTVRREGDVFVVEEACRNWFSVRLTKEQFRVLVEELRALVENTREEETPYGEK